MSVGGVRRAIVVAVLVSACGGGLQPLPTTFVPPPTSPPATSPASDPVPTEAPGSPPPQGTPEPAPGATPGPLPQGTWTRVDSSGDAPAAREDHTWTVADDARTAFLFGGRDGGREFGDLWAYDLAGDRWSRVVASGPGPEARFGHEAAWVAGRGLVIFGGQAGTRFFDDLWVFDPGSGRWSKLPPGDYAPVARYGSCSGVDGEGRLWISHGFTEDGVRFSDTHAYDFAAATWTDQFAGGAPPIVRCLHACWWTSDGRFALYGGQTTGIPAIGDLWLLTPSAPGAHEWTEVRGELPPARQLAAVARLGPRTVVVGGRGQNGQALDDAWQLVDGAPGFVSLETTGRTPAARSGATLVGDPERGRLLLFGGLAADERADLWSLAWP